MKLVHKSLERDGAGSIALVPEEAEDMWHAFNLIQKEDAVRASTVRKVVNESATGSRSSDKVRTTLTVQVEDIFFDTQVGHTQGCLPSEDYGIISVGWHAEVERKKYRGEPTREDGSIPHHRPGAA